MSRIVLYEEVPIKKDNSSRFKKGHNPWNKGLSWKEQGVSNENKNKKLSNLRAIVKDWSILSAHGFVIASYDVVPLFIHKDGQVLFFRE